MYNFWQYLPPLKYTVLCLSLMSICLCLCFSWLSCQLLEPNNKHFQRSIGRWFQKNVMSNQAGSYSEQILYSQPEIVISQWRTHWLKELFCKTCVLLKEAIKNYFPPWRLYRWHWKETIWKCFFMTIYIDDLQNVGSSGLIRYYKDDIHLKYLWKMDAIFI